jgi:hypothetical protein
MPGPQSFAQSRTYPFPVEHCFDFTIVTPLTALFSRWFGPLPPVRSVDGPEPWGAVGLARTVRTADGGSMYEEMLAVQRPERFAYRLSRITGALRWLVSSVDGAWRFEPIGTGTRIEWSWTIHPASRLADAALPIVGKLWKGYARQSLERLEQLMVTDQS